MDATNETATIAGSKDSLQSNVSWSTWNVLSLQVILNECNKNVTSTGRTPVQTFVTVTALPLNAIIFWLFLKKKKVLSPSEVLGLNLTLLNIIICCSLPLDIYISLKQRAGLLLQISQTFAILSYFGCPFLLTTMCVERYVAVSHPVAFMKLRKWEYRAAGSGIIWLLTFMMAGICYIYGVSSLAMFLSIFINVLFFFMLASLLGIIFVLFKKKPGARRTGEQSDSVKKRALKNILAVLVPSTIVYGPLLTLAPFILMLQSIRMEGLNMFLCSVLVLFGILPNFGVCIGPVFYMSRIRELLCCRNTDVRDSRQTRTDYQGH